MFAQVGAAELAQVGAAEFAQVDAAEFAHQVGAAIPLHEAPAVGAMRNLDRLATSMARTTTFDELALLASDLAEHGGVALVAQAS